MSADVHIQAAAGGRGEVRVDGVDLTPFLRAIGFDMELGREPRFVLEGAGRLEAVLKGQGIDYRRVPLLSGEDRRLLEAAAAAFEEDSPERRRYEMLLELLLETCGPRPDGDAAAAP